MSETRANQQEKRRVGDGVRGRLSTRWGWLIALVFLLVACSPTGLPVAMVSTPTPLPPTATPTPTASPTPTLTPTATPSPTPTLTTTPAAKEAEAAAPVPTATPTPDRLVWVITEDMINETLSSGSFGEAEVKNPSIQFTNGQIIASAELLRYGFLSINNLQATVSVWAEDGKVQVRFEQLQPNNLMTRLLPGVAAQLLEQYTAGWYVLDIQIGEGEMTIVVRP